MRNDIELLHVADKARESRRNLNFKIGLFSFSWLERQNPVSSSPPDTRHRKIWRRKSSVQKKFWWRQRCGKSFIKLNFVPFLFQAGALVCSRERKLFYCDVENEKLSEERFVTSLRSNFSLGTLRQTILICVICGSFTRFTIWCFVFWWLRSDRKFLDGFKAFLPAGRRRSLWKYLIKRSVCRWDRNLFARRGLEPFLVLHLLHGVRIIEFTQRSVDAALI